MKKRWRWSGQEAAEIPKRPGRNSFHHLDECKPLDGGAKLLVCASNGGCALIERASGRVLWRARSRNAHSLDLLPHDRIVVASSLSGDHLEVFDLKAPPSPFSRPRCIRPMASCGMKPVAACGRSALMSCAVTPLRTGRRIPPSLTLESSHALPDPDGHDLRPLPASNDLLLTTGSGVFLFDRTKPPSGPTRSSRRRPR